MSGDGWGELGWCQDGKATVYVWEGTLYVQFNSEYEYIRETAVPKIVSTKTSYSLLFFMKPHSLSKSTKYTQNTKGKPFIFRIFSFFKLWLLSVPFTDRVVYSENSPLLFSLKLGAFSQYNIQGRATRPWTARNRLLRVHLHTIQDAASTPPPLAYCSFFASPLIFSLSVYFVLYVERPDHSSLHCLVNHPEKNILIPVTDLRSPVWFASIQSLDHRSLSLYVMEPVQCAFWE